MKIALINKSDSTGGAAIVSLRLTNALRLINNEASLLVAEKLTDSPYTRKAASDRAILRHMVTERLGIFFNNGFNRGDLFKVDTADSGLPLWKHPVVMDADIVVLGWVNQGMLSIKGIEKIRNLGKPIVWIMHDMWCLTGICHHAGNCHRYIEECGECKFLGNRKCQNDISHKVWKRKKKLYSGGGIYFLPVSSWLERKCRESSLLSDAFVRTIPNPFPLPPRPCVKTTDKEEIRILFGAARLDDPIKGLPYLKEALNIFATEYPELTSMSRLITFGSIRDSSLLEGLPVAHTHLGMITDPAELRSLYAGGDIVVSTSLFETLPGTLVEGQAYGCIPVAFNRGGQHDIIEHRYTGYIAAFSDKISEGARDIAEGIVWAIANRSEKMTERMFRSVSEKFDAVNVALRYVSLFEDIISGEQHH